MNNNEMIFNKRVKFEVGSRITLGLIFILIATLSILMESILPSNIGMVIVLILLMIIYTVISKVSEGLETAKKLKLEAYMPVLLSTMVLIGITQFLAFSGNILPSGEPIIPLAEAINLVVIIYGISLVCVGIIRFLFENKKLEDLKVRMTVISVLVLLGLNLSALAIYGTEYTMLFILIFGVTNYLLLNNNITWTNMFVEKDGKLISKLDMTSFEEKGFKYVPYNNHTTVQGSLFSSMYFMLGMFELAYGLPKMLSMNPS